MITLDDFIAGMKSRKRSVILLEGTRNVPDQDQDRLIGLGKRLTALLPEAVFRSGNAPGADEAFSKGVCGTRPSSMQYVVPYLSHRIKTRSKAAGVISLDQVPDSEFSLIMEKTLEASPDYAGLVNLYQKHGKWDRHTIKLRYLLRDALKVVGSRALGLAPAACGIFYVNELTPLSGGTGHTIRVCRKSNVLVVDQKAWLAWDFIERLSA